MDTLREVEPTSHMGVPRVWEKIMERIQEVAAQSGFIRRKMLRWAMSVTLEQNLTCPGRYGSGGQEAGGSRAGAAGQDGLRTCWAGLLPGTPVQRPHRALGWRPLPRLHRRQSPHLWVPTGRTHSLPWGTFTPPPAVLTVPEAFPDSVGGREGPQW